MFRPRIIPVLLLDNGGLVKTIGFKKPKYIGDPINTVKIFNELEADELILLDISASRNNRSIPIEIVQKVGAEAFMPFSVGGGISTIEHAAKCIREGAEKIVLDTHAALNPDLISQCAQIFGSQSVVVSINVKKDFFGKYCAYYLNGKNKIKLPLKDWVLVVEEKGAGEIIINDIRNDGVMKGYDLDLIKHITNLVNIPVVACGGAGNVEDMNFAIQSGAHAAASGSVFIYQGERKAVLINYPNKMELKEKFNEKI